MKKIILGFSVGISILQSFTYENYQLYKDIHIMKMGGANVGLGGSGTAVFYNPAGLSNLNKKDGAEIKLINLSVSTNENVLNIAEDGLALQDIQDSDEQSLEAIRITKEHLGENNHFEVSNFSYIAKGVKNMHFSLGALSNMNLDFKTHRGFGTDGILDIQSLIVGGAVFGLSYDYSKKISVGAGVKYLQYGSIQKNFTIGTVIEHTNNFDTYIKDEVLKDGTSIVFDLGGLYQMSKHWQIGLSALNLGGIGEEKHLTYIPSTYNLGIGYQQDFTKSYLKKIQFGFDYIDLTNQYIESDKMKKVRTGFEAVFIDNPFITIKSGLGLYQGYYTAGLSFRLTVIEIALTTYAEEIGAYSGQDEDRRYLLNLTIGW
jgi:hypothetical protein